MHVYTATIGRNVGVEPMPSARWHQFINDVHNDMVLFAVEAAIHVEDIEIHEGKGRWLDKPEDSAKISILSPSLADDRALGNLRRLLSENARQYGQDAIALTIGESELC